MDANQSPARNSTPSAAAPGGTVEPAHRAVVAKERSQTPTDLPGERYELRDPFAEVTYRANNFAEMVARADQLGSHRFIALDEDGHRSTIQKVNGEWQRGPTRPTAPERPVDTTLIRDDGTPVTNVAPNRTPSDVAQAPAQPVPADARAIAKLDAQAERSAQVARIKAALMERYVIKLSPIVGDVTFGRTEYRFRGDTSRIAFTESTFRLATDTNSPSVARSMVDVAEARNWRALRVSGHEDFKRLVWLEASVRGVKTLGYEPNPVDLDVLKKEQEARLVNRIEHARVDNPGAGETSSEKSPARGGGGRKAGLAAIEATAVMAAATEKLAQRIRAGQGPKVKVYDKAAPSQRPAVVPTPEVQRTRERPAPVR